VTKTPDLKLSIARNVVGSRSPSRGGFIDVDACRCVRWVDVDGAPVGPAVDVVDRRCIVNGFDDLILIDFSFLKKVRQCATRDPITSDG
jgi:hypothetical protein